MCACAHISARACVCVCTREIYMNTHKYTCAYTQAYTHTYTYLYVCI